MVDDSRLDGLTHRPGARPRPGQGRHGEVKLHIQRFEAAAPEPSGSPAPASTPKPRALIEEFDVTLVQGRSAGEVTARELADGTVGYVRLSGFSGRGGEEAASWPRCRPSSTRASGRSCWTFAATRGGFIVERVRGERLHRLRPGTWRGREGVLQTKADAERVATDPSIQVVALIDRGTASRARSRRGGRGHLGRAADRARPRSGRARSGISSAWSRLEGVKLTRLEWSRQGSGSASRSRRDIPVTVPADTPPGEDPVLDRALEVLGATSGSGVAAPPT